MSTATYLDGLGIQFKALLLVGQELLNIFSLVALELNHLSHLHVADDGAIASWKWEVSTRHDSKIKRRTKPTELLLDHLQDLLLIKLLRKTLHGGQSLSTIALCMQHGG